MAVWQHAYDGYSGPRSSGLAPALVIARYAVEDAFRGRLLVALYLASLVPLLAVMSVMYMRYNLEFLASFQIPLDQLVIVDGSFFARYVQLPQCVLALAMIVITGPALIAPDLRNNALPLYLARAVSRHHYVAGKLLALLVLGSLLMWIPGWLLVIFQTVLEGPAWLAAHIHVPLAMLVCSALWLVAVGMLSLAVSAWVKWKQVARIALFGLVFVGAAFGEAIRGIFGGWGGGVLSLFDAMEAVISAVYQTSGWTPMPASAGAGVFFVVIVLASVVLYRRIRACEVHV